MTKEEVIKAISDVKHTAIDHSLLDLGIVKNVRVEDDKVKITFSFPFPQIPIADMLVNSIDQPLQSIGINAEYDFTVMDEKERAEFLRMEKEAWRG
jgi:ATP-binding protein involved in chromosome partitioning